MANTRKNVDIVKGDELWLFIGTENSLAPTAFATSHSLSRSLATTTVSSKDHGSTSYVVPGEGSWTVSTEALYSVNAFEDVMGKFDLGQLVYVQFGKIDNYTAQGIVDNDNPEWTLTSGWTGKGYITSLEAAGQHGDSATFSIQITGIGPLTKVSQG